MHVSMLGKEQKTCQTPERYGTAFAIVRCQDAGASVQPRDGSMPRLSDMS